jgi:hypothetical protein
MSIARRTPARSTLKLGCNPADARPHAPEHIVGQPEETSS